ncbi:DNA-binding transcriptional regulator [Pluralibacter gergoviae]|uniref:DNA-binding transcriptional regulator n=1 Tax=Pluralibacter gergoviae TaxID=61647 RepID=UPI000A35E0C2|nr:DNA-binding transcriptional regulator [Pluralibacter gergoviae]EKT9641096.1 DNA-binding transcriptional activator MhpR [Pluralibacter gergoviae]EKV3546340.1 DNA-binding transcriptional activator MhpR [Pluralibacter gergoviae]EKV9901404.1 DNA-binding transcriptional activator MhpR [Pluralibacter gergoviae]EKV9933152.1 DNA-binding transcriptional activator MhpR [Pluralibacter gergoviae]EKW9975707.1 DNA-binding transcriptional activator MhpR [Pluralibacter gergoviae]
MPTDGGADYKTVRGLTRGLALLNALNRLDGGAGIAELSELTNLHRTTVRRLLETLQEEGYVRRSRSDDSYRLTLKVRELSEGFRDEQWISAIAAPLLGKLLQEVVWPTDLTTLDVDAMVVRETTHRFSRLSFHRSMVGRRLPLLQTASGLTWLAFCPDHEREELISLLAAREEPEYRLAREPLRLASLLRRIRQNGYGENYMTWQQEQKIASIAVPVCGEGGAIAVLNLVYIAQAMSIEQAAGRYLGALQATAGKIEAGIRASAGAQQAMEAAHGEGGDKGVL